ncbi:MAG TPA: beta-ketoacyl-ACP synthase III [Bdellovibrionota bacterium]|jgi:3-oxoacyl-[acyl-carrier-protein] synthase-3
MSSSQKRSRIAALGSCFPEQVVTNRDIEKLVDTSDQWISERTGIKERRKLRDGENNSDIAAGAALAALKKAKVDPSEVDLIIACTTSPDRIMPNLASVVQAKIGAPPSGAAFDIAAACASWMAGVQVADALVTKGSYKNVLVIGTEALTRFLNWKDRGTCVLFGDGAGASLIQPCKPGDPGEILDIEVHADGRYGDILDVPGGGSRCPTNQEVVDKNLQFIHMNGQEIYKHAVRDMVSVCESIMERHKLTVNDIDWFVPHQANIRIIDTIGKKLGFPSEKVAINVDKYGNTSAATVPTCFDEYVDAGKIKKGDLVLMTTFGGGLVWAGALVRW